jgi:hypothetical protein
MAKTSGRAAQTWNNMAGNSWLEVIARFGYAVGHANNDTDGDPENVACRACSRGRANYDVRHNLYIQSSYPLPLGRGKSTLGPERDPARREATLMGYQLAIVPARG